MESDSGMGFMNALGAEGQADPTLMVIVRQVMVLTFVLLALFAACLSRQGSAVHMWLESAWWLVGTTLAIFLTVSGIIQLVSNKDLGTNMVILAIIELAELIVYLLLAIALSVTRGGPKFGLARTAFWVATIILVVLWSVSSLLDIMTSERALPGTILTMAATLIVAVLMIADMCVTQWRGNEREGSSQPFLPNYGNEDVERKAAHGKGDAIEA